MKPVEDVWSLDGTEIPPPFARCTAMVSSPETGGMEGATVLAARIPPGGGTDLHAHETSAELMYIVAGQGRGTLEGATYDLRQGVAFWTPAGRWHRIENTGPSDMQVLCFYVPPLPPGYVQAALERAISGRQRDR